MLYSAVLSTHHRVSQYHSHPWRSIEDIISILKIAWNVLTWRRHLMDQEASSSLSNNKNCYRPVYHVILHPHLEGLFYVCVAFLKKNNITAKNKTGEKRMEREWHYKMLKYLTSKLPIESTGVHGTKVTIKTENSEFFSSSTRTCCFVHCSLLNPALNKPQLARTRPQTS